MAIYKIPQDVEAEDKLLGPFSFRQFIYLIVAALGIFMAVILFQIFPGLILIPLPFVLLFLVLALPLRKDQPMETYLVAVIRFFLKPHKRMWQPEGSIGLVTIVAPKAPEQVLTKEFGGTEAAQRLGYLAQVLDTQGWSTRGVVNPNISMTDTAYAEAQNVEDVLAEDTSVSQAFNSMIDQSTDNHKKSVVQQFQNAVKSSNRSKKNKTTNVIDDEEPISQPTPTDDSAVTVQLAADDTVDPYSTDINQSTVTPHSTSAAQSKTADTSAHHKRSSPSASAKPVSPDILRLANNNDLSISALANEAHRLTDGDEEVVISLR